MRDNEVEKVAAVVEHAQRGEPQAAVDALMRLWVEMPEQPDRPDTAQHDAWREIASADAVKLAADAGLAVVRDGRKIRPAAFIDLSEAVAPEVLVDLAELVVARKWPPYPYLAAVLARMIEHKQEKLVEAFIAKHRDAFAADPDSWLLVGFVLTTSRVGNNSEVSRWFENAEQRANVPLWILVARVATVPQEVPSIAKMQRGRFNWMMGLVHAAMKHAAPDDSAGYFVCLVILEHLIHGRVDAFRAAMDEHRALLERQTTTSLFDHPLVRYANGVKHQHPLTAKELEFRRYRGLPSSLVNLPGYLQEAKDRPLNLMLAELVADIGDLIDSSLRVFALFEQMLALERGDPRVGELAREMDKVRGTTLPWLQPAWNRVLKARLPWTGRVKLALGVG